jgi:hypothetical protein
MGLIMGLFEKCGCKWKDYDECWKGMCCSSKTIDKESYTDYSSDKKITVLEQKISQLEQHYTFIYEENTRLHNKCVVLEEKDSNRDKTIQKVIWDIGIMAKTIESLEQRVSTIHLDKSENAENEFIVIA